MAGFMKNAMSYLGMSDVAEGEDDFEDDVDTGETSFDSDHSVTPMPSSSASASTPSAPREQSNPFQGGRVSRITTIHPKTYDDAQMVGRAIRDGIPVVLNLTGVAEADGIPHRRLLRPGVVFGRGENGNFTRLYWGIRGHKFMYPGRKDTIKACIYVKELVRFMLYRLEYHDSGVELYNCCYEPAYTIEHIVESMKRVTNMKVKVPFMPGWLIMTAAGIAGALGSPMGICPARVRKLQISTNICGKKLSASGYRFHYTFEEALADWYKDNGNLYLQ